MTSTFSTIRAVIPAVNTGRFSVALMLAGLGFLVPDVALAHHVMDGALPQTFFEGLLSGIGHPVIGLDHLAFVIGVGLLAGLARSAAWLPLAFVTATVAGTAVHLAGLDLPLAEMAIGLSVLAAAVAVFLQLQLPNGVLAGLFAAAGLFHGYAYGESIVGAEPAPLGAYLLGFAMVQYVIALVGAAALGQLAVRGDMWKQTGMRLAGVAIAIVGTTALWNALYAL